MRESLACVSIVLMLALCAPSCSGGGAPPPVGGRAVNITASASSPPSSGPPTVKTILTHNLHQDPSVLNANAGRAALLELAQDDLVLASHAYIPNTAAGAWNFAGLDKLVNFVTAPPLKGTLFYNAAHSPAYLSMGGIPGGRPANDAEFAKYLQRVLLYYNTPNGFSDGGTTYQRTPARFEYVEMWGEPDLNEFFDDNHLPVAFAQMTATQAQNFFSTPQAYRTTYEVVAPALKAADPTVKVGGPTISSIEDPAARAYITALLGTSAPLDFVSYHDYAAWTQPSTDQQAFDEIAALIGQAQQVQQAIAASSHPQAELWITEGNGNATAYVAPLDQRSWNDFDVPYLASLARGYILAGVAGYARFELIEDVNDAYAALDGNGSRRPAFFGWKLLTNDVVRGSNLRASSSSDPSVEALAFQPTPSTLHVLVINKSVRAASDNSTSASAGGAPVAISLAIADRSVASARLERVDPSTSGIQTLDLPSGPILSFSIQGYGIACIIATLK
jgi:hypothetical protein